MYGEATWINTESMISDGRVEKTERLVEVRRDLTKWGKVGVGERERMG